MELRCERIGKTYATRNGGVCALDSVTFAVRPEEFVCIVGPSGCGKTTLLKLVAGLLAPTAGTIEFSADSGSRTARTALVFQEHGLFPWLTVLDNVALGLEMLGVAKQERRRRARTFIERVGLASFSASYPHELSVGMRQRVGIARAFVSRPQILLMDEPFGSLDAQTRLVLQDEVVRLWKEDRMMVILVTHDVDEAVRLGSRVLVMSGRPGRIQEEITIPLDRSRGLSADDPIQASEIKRHIWKLLESEVRRQLWMSS